MGTGAEFPSILHDQSHQPLLAQIQFSYRASPVTTYSHLYAGATLVK